MYELLFFLLAAACMSLAILWLIVQLRQRRAAAQPEKLEWQPAPAPRHSPEERLLFARRDIVALPRQKIAQLGRAARLRVDVFKARHGEVMKAIALWIKPGNLEDRIAVIRDTAEGEINEQSGAPARFDRLREALADLDDAMDESDILDDGIARVRHAVDEASNSVADEIRKADAAEKLPLLSDLDRAQDALGKAKGVLTVAANKAKEEQKAPATTQ